MQSMTPMPDNPWPHGMVLSIKDDAHQLLELLWVREAWGLTPEEDQPPLLVHAPDRVGDPPSRDEWESAWAELWAATTSHNLSRSTQQDLQERITAASDAEARLALLQQFVGPSWHGRFGDETLGEQFRMWSHRRFVERRARMQTTLAETPERICLDALIPAWEAGLETVVTIPCVGDYTRVLDEHTLLITDEQRHSPARYTRALGIFMHRSSL